MILTIKKYPQILNVTNSINTENKISEPIDKIVDKPKEKIIVKFRGSDYDITDFIKRHPGGKSILIKNNGNDIEQLMLKNEHSDRAYKLLEKYKINK